MAKGRAVAIELNDVVKRELTTLTRKHGSGLGSALGSWSGGLLHDWAHSYNPLIAFALISVLLGMIPFLVVPALRR